MKTKSVHFLRVDPDFVLVFFSSFLFMFSFIISIGWKQKICICKWENINILLLFILHIHLSSAQLVFVCLLSFGQNQKWYKLSEIRQSILCFHFISRLNWDTDAKNMLKENYKMIRPFIYGTAYHFVCLFILLSWLTKQQFIMHKVHPAALNVTKTKDTIECDNTFFIFFSFRFRVFQLTSTKTNITKIRVMAFHFLTSIQFYISNDKMITIKFYFVFVSLSPRFSLFRWYFIQFIIT